MKVKVTKQYRDKYTNNLHKVGTTIEVTKERYEELNSTSLGIFVEDAEEKINLTDMSKKELINYSKEKGIKLDTTMTKAEMIKELI